MKTIDIHIHLLNSNVKFDRFYDKFVIFFFKNKFGINSKELIKNPYSEYIRIITENTKESKYIEKIVLFGVDDRVNEKGETIHSDITVCASNEDLLKVYSKYKDKNIPFFQLIQ